jgi:hypothetical protein
LLAWRNWGTGRKVGGIAQKVAGWVDPDQPATGCDLLLTIVSKCARTKRGCNEAPRTHLQTREGHVDGATLAKPTAIKLHAHAGDVTPCARQTAQGSRWPHGLRIHLQMLAKGTGSIYSQPIHQMPGLNISCSSGCFSRAQSVVVQAFLGDIGRSEPPRICM